MSSSGVWGVVIKQDVLKRNNLHFHEYFGPGTENYCGEDTIFLQEMINKGVKFYRSPVDIAAIDQTESTWFNGHDQKYFYVTGMVFATCYPKLCRLIVIRSAFRFSRKKDCKLSFFKILSAYNKGISKIKKG